MQEVDVTTEAFIKEHKEIGIVRDTIHQNPESASILPALLVADGWIREEEVETETEDGILENVRLVGIPKVGEVLRRYGSDPYSREPKSSAVVDITEKVMGDIPLNLKGYISRVASSSIPAAASLFASLTIGALAVRDLITREARNWIAEGVSSFYPNFDKSDAKIIIDGLRETSQVPFIPNEMKEFLNELISFPLNSEEVKNKVIEMTEPMLVFSPFASTMIIAGCAIGTLYFGHNFLNNLFYPLLRAYLKSIC